jgi:hypothetical protein
MQRVFLRHFDIGRNGKVPTRQTILNWVTQFRTTASVVNKKPPGRPQTVRTPENVRRLAHVFQRRPQRSARCHSIALRLTPRTSKIDLTTDAVILNCLTQFNIVWRVGTFPFLPMSKCRRKSRCITVAESLFLKKTFPQQYN